MNVLRPPENESPAPRPAFDYFPKPSVVVTLRSDLMFLGKKPLPTSETNVSQAPTDERNTPQDNKTNSPNPNAVPVSNAASHSPSSAPSLSNNFAHFNSTTDHSTPNHNDEPFPAPTVARDKFPSVPLHHDSSNFGGNMALNAYPTSTYDRYNPNLYVQPSQADSSLMFTPYPTPNSSNTYIYPSVPKAYSNSGFKTKWANNVDQSYLYQHPTSTPNPNVHPPGQLNPHQDPNTLDPNMFSSDAPTLAEIVKIARFIAMNTSGSREPSKDLIQKITKNLLALMPNCSSILNEKIAGMRSENQNAFVADCEISSGTVHKKTNDSSDCQIIGVKIGKSTNPKKHQIKPSDRSPCERFICDLCQKVFRNKKWYILHRKKLCDLLSTKPTNESQTPGPSNELPVTIHEATYTVTYFPLTNTYSENL